MTVKILHFADAHIDSYTGGRIDSNNGRSVHMNDFLSALDGIIDAAISEQVQLVLFAGDAYRSPVPVPTFQREWQRRIVRLAEARIPILIIPGNHDISPNSFKASSLQELDTLPVPYIHYAAKGIHLYKPDELDGVPIQVIAVPWMPLSRKAARDRDNTQTPEERAAGMESDITNRIRRAVDQSDPDLPLVLLAHYSVQGSKYPSGQTAELGREVTLSRSLVCDPVFTYTALGHIHLFQDLNEGSQPPAVYPGSIERVDYGEAKEKKGYIIADLSPHHASYSFRELHTRPMYNLSLEISSAETMQQEIIDALPPAEKIPGAMIRLEFSYPHEWESMFSERELRRITADALDFQLKRKPIHTNRIRLQNPELGSFTPADTLRAWCQVSRISDTETENLLALAGDIFNPAQLTKE